MSAGLKLRRGVWGERLGLPQLFLFLALAPGLAQAADAPCPPPIAEEIDDVPLPHLAAGLKPGATLYALVVGSATVLGPDLAPAPPVAAGAGGKGQPPAAPAPSPTGFPWQMARALEAGVHNLHVALTVIGSRGLSAEDMLARITQELPKHPYRVVLWQTGTVDAVNELPPGDFYETLADGAATVANAGADLVLIDPQYSRFLQDNANLEPYQDALQTAAALPGVSLFHRFDLMHAWADSHALDLERTARADRPAVAARLHACLGRELARQLVAQAGAAGR